MLILSLIGCESKKNEIISEQIPTSVFDSNENFTLHYLYSENKSKEQTATADLLYSKIDDSKLRSVLEKYIAESVSNSESKMTEFIGMAGKIMG